MMILKCDETSDAGTLAQDVGLSPKTEAKSVIQPLIDQRFVSDVDGKLTLLDKCEEAVAKIWTIHESTERLAFDGIPDQKKEIFLKVIHKMQQNCEKIIPYM